MSQPPPNGRNRPEQSSLRRTLDAIRAGGRALLAHPNTLRDLDPVAEAALLTGARAAVILVRSELRDSLTVEAAAGLDTLGERAPFLEAARRLAAWTGVSREPVLVDDFAADPRFNMAVAGKAGAAAAAVPAPAAAGGSFAAVPLLVFGEVIGAIVLVHREAAGRPAPFDASHVHFAGILADQAGLAIQAVRASEKAARLEKKLKTFEAERMKREGLVTLGEMTKTLIGEIRQPVAAIAGFARRVERSLKEGDLNREYLDVIITETERLDRMVAEHLEMVPGLKSHFRMEDLNAVVASTLKSFRETLVTKRVRCLNRLATGLPLLLLDAGKIELLVRNIIADLLASIPAGGRLKIESKRAGETVHLIIAADGPKAPGDVLDRLFVPFGGQRSQAPVLAATHQIVKEHGGEIGVRSDSEWATLFTVSFPIKANADRRRAGGDRRKSRAERRSKDQGRNAA